MKHKWDELKKYLEWRIEILAGADKPREVWQWVALTTTLKKMQELEHGWGPYEYRRDSEVIPRQHFF